MYAQIPYMDYQNPFSQTYLGFGNAIETDVGFDAGNLYMPGSMAFSAQNQVLLFKKSSLNTSAFKIYYANPQTTMENMLFKHNLKYYYAFISTDGTTSCPSAGLKVLKINKSNLSLADSIFFCDPTKPSGGFGYFFYNHFYTNSAYSQYFPPPLPPTYSKRRNLIRRIDTNLVMLNEQVLGDTTSTFEAYNLREAIDRGIILNSLNIEEYCPMLIKLDTMGVEQWRKNYYTNTQNGGCATNSNNGIMGLQNYKNGYIALFNLGFGCSQYLYSQSIIAKLDRSGNLVKEVQYTTTGDTTLEFYSNFTNYTKRTKFYNILIKTNDGNYASVICDRERYGFNNHENYIVILDTNLNIIQRSPKLGSLSDLNYPGMVQGTDSVFYLGGGVMNSTNDGMNVRIYTWKPGGQVGVMEYGDTPPLKLYPNPVINELTVESNEVHKTVFIYNAMGELVYQQVQSGVFKIGVSTWAKGIYLLEMRDEKSNAKQISKFVVE